MLNIVTALYFEAKPIIDRFGLKRVEDKFAIYQNETLKLIISGVGKINSSIATTYMLSKNPNPTINIGICANKSKIGECFAINKIVDYDSKKCLYPDILLKHGFKEGTITTHSTSISKNSPTLVDMESSGFFIACSRFLNCDDIYLLKIVSDNFNPKSLSGEYIASLIGNNMNKIEEFIQNIISQDKLDISYNKDVFNKISHKLRLTKYQKYELKSTLIYAKLRKIDLDKLDIKRGVSKNASKEEFARIKKELINNLHRA